jgi:hypothetical protein
MTSAKTDTRTKNDSGRFAILALLVAEPYPRQDSPKREDLLPAPLDAREKLGARPTSPTQPPRDAHMPVVLMIDLR